MRKLLTALALAGILLTAAPASAQPYNGNWNRNDFWRGAPSDVYQRIDYLQRRIDRGVRDGTLTRREAQRAQYQLDRIRRDASYMRRNGFDSGEQRAIQARLDDVSRN